MPITRTRFNIATDTGGDMVDTGPPINGMPCQIYARLGNMDTGCDIKMESVETGMVIADYKGVGGGAFTRIPRALTYDTGGGSSVGDNYMVLANERIRLTVREGPQASDTGTLFLYTMN